jgi:hypothetical protein
MNRASTVDSGLRLLRAAEIAGGQVGPVAVWSKGLDGITKEPVLLEGKSAGHTWEDAFGRWCCLTGMVPYTQSLSPAAQFR